MASDQLRVVAAGLVALALALAFPAPANAQKSKGDAGTGGAAGYSPVMPDTSRGMRAPNPDFEAPSSAEASGPMYSPPADNQKKEKVTPPSDDAAKAK